RQTAANQELEEKLASYQLLLLEKEAQAKELDKKLDEATLEVVRTKAKLRSLESKAEAASTLAEGEIALKALKSNAVGFEKDSEVLQAEDLLKASNQELKKENYGGALYLATRAKAIIKEGQERSRDREKTPIMKGEVTFAIPLRLQMVNNGNIRESPGLDSKVLFTLREGSTIVGYSYRGLWVRVRTEGGRGGWVYYSLIGGR
ncbi:MAG TPA: SH3 domain-containing protein, partial [Nitrospiria bacterium]|nr:SH3 domain-containing protein [Nitrospiria bacterium]